MFYYYYFLKLFYYLILIYIGIYIFIYYLIHTLIDLKKILKEKYFEEGVVSAFYLFLKRFKILDQIAKKNSTFSTLYRFW